MQITINRQQLSDAMTTAAPLAGRASGKEILQYALLVFGTARTALEATDTECSISLDIPDAKVNQAGKLLLHFGRVGQIAKAMTDQYLTIETTDSGITIIGSAARFDLPMPKVAEYPTIDFNEIGQQISLPSAALRTMLHRCIYACDQNSTRFALGGVRIESSSESLVAVGTDGRRLTLQKADIIGDSDRAAIIPVRAAVLLDRLLGQSQQETTLTLTDHRIIVRTAGATVASQQVEGRYPNWRQLLVSNRAGETLITTNAGTLAAAVRQAAIVADSETAAMDISIYSDHISLDSSAADSGKSTVKMPITGGPEHSKATRLNHKYLSDFLRVLDPATSITINALDSKSSVVFTTGDGYTYIMMPMDKA